MPWCDECSRFYNPNSLPSTGVCPGCGATLMKPSRLRRAQQGKGGGPDAVAAAAARRNGASSLDPGAGSGEESSAVPGEGEGDHTPVPWHFWVLVVALVIYLGWRLVQLIMWLAK